MPARKRRDRLAPAGRRVRASTPADARRLQTGELHRQRFSGRTHIKQPLAAIIGAFFLHDVAFIDQLLEDATERLFGDFQHIEQFGDLHAGIAVDEVQHAVVGAAEAELFQHLVRITDEFTIGEEQKFDEVPARLSIRHGTLGSRRGARFG